MTTTRWGELEAQNDEFKALEDLIKVYKIHQITAVVDDDYPEVRHQYETKLHAFLLACSKNGRLWKRG